MRIAGNPNSATIALASLTGLLWLVFLFVLGSAGTAGADDQSCIVKMNKAGAKVSRAQAKDSYRCVKDAGRGSESDPAACLVADSRGKVQSKRDKTVSVESSDCDPAPSFGYSSAWLVNSSAVEETAALVYGAFGLDLDAALLGYDDSDRAKCQASVVKASGAMLRAQLSTFTSCKKSGLARGDITGSVSLQACFDDLSADVRGKIESATGKLDRALSSKCAALNTATTFPGDCAGVSDFAACIEALAACSACRMLDRSDALSEECDLFDDGLPNASCDTPVTTTTSTTSTSTTSTTFGTVTSTTLAGGLSYPVVDTGQVVCYDASLEISAPAPGQSFYGQDAQHVGNTASYTLSGDQLTVLDNVSGLTWTADPDLDGDGDIDADDKLSWSGAQSYVNTLNATGFGGYFDWRLPTIKELYSLILFSGLDVSGYSGSTDGLTPFIDTDYFSFGYGDEAAGERVIDAQYWSSTEYVSTTMAGDHTVFGVNFADGRIKGYGTSSPVGGGDKTEYVRWVRGNPAYGINDFSDNADGTVSDHATGLMWAQADSGAGMDWESALAWVEQKNAESYLGHGDWRLPDAKELQSIIDYSRSPATTSSAAIDPVFSVSTIVDEGGGTDYPFYWASTTHANMGVVPGGFGAYLAFGRALGFMEQPPSSGNYSLLDVHGAGSQRSDPKSGDPADWPNGNGPQGDVVRIYNHVRLVR